jgi:hypothetical protein
LTVDDREKSARFPSCARFPKSTSRFRGTGLNAGAVDESSSGAPIDRFEASRRLGEGRRAYELALLVQERTTAFAIDSAPLAAKAIRIALTLLIENRGPSAPRDFEGLVREGMAVARKNGLTLPEDGADLLLIGKMATAFNDDVEVSHSSARQYHHAVVRLGNTFDSIEQEVLAQLPPKASRLRRYSKPWALIAAGFSGGVVLTSVLRHWAAAPAPVPQAPAASLAKASSAPAVASKPAFSATYFHDEELKSVAFERLEPSIDFDWGSDGPTNLPEHDHFSARWAGKLFVPSQAFYQFFLTSDDGARVLVDGVVVNDNWGGHAVVTTETRVELTAGVHPIVVEYFDSVGGAIVRLEWASDAFARRIMTGADLR